MSPPRVCVESVSRSGSANVAPPPPHDRAAVERSPRAQAISGRWRSTSFCLGSNLSSDARHLSTRGPRTSALLRPRRPLWRALELARASAEPCRPRAPAPTPRMPAGPLYTALPRLSGVHAARRRELRPLRRARGPVRRPPDAARRHVHVRLRQQLHRALQTRL